MKTTPKEFLEKNAEKMITIRLPYFIIHNIMVHLHERIMDDNISPKLREELCGYNLVLIEELKNGFPECAFMYLKDADQEEQDNARN